MGKFKKTQQDEYLRLLNKGWGYPDYRGSPWSVTEAKGMGYVQMDEEEYERQYGFTQRANTGRRDNMGSTDPRTDRETYLLHFDNSAGERNYFRQLPYATNEPLPVSRERSKAGLFSSDHFLQVRRLEEARQLTIRIENAKTGKLLGEEDTEMLNDVNKEEGISNDYIEAIIAEVHKKADCIDYEAGQMGRSSNTGDRMRQQVRFYRMGQNKEIPKEWKEFEKKFDPEWGEYQRLKDKFEKGEL